MAHTPAYTNTSTAVGAPVASPHVTIYLAFLETPDPGNIYPSLTFATQVRGESDDASALNLQVQASYDPFFTSPLAYTLTGQNSGDLVSITVGPFTDDTVIYLRVRSGVAPLWSSWTPYIAVSVNTALGGGLAYIYENVGVLLILEKEGAAYIYENVGPNYLPTKKGIAYLYEGDVNSNPPKPQIWAISPTQGRPADGIKIYGHGFGATQGTYSGTVEMYIGVVWEACSVTSWVGNIAATANAYNANRKIEPLVPYFDPEHSEVQFVIPNDAVPLGHLIHVETTT